MVRLWRLRFSEENFSAITVGMTKDEVNGLLGKPLRETCITGCEWVYSWQADPTASFDWRSIHFDDFGRVESKRREFFIDQVHFDAIGLKKVLDC